MIGASSSSTKPEEFEHFLSWTLPRESTSVENSLSVSSKCVEQARLEIELGSCDTCQSEIDNRQPIRSAISLQHTRADRRSVAWIGFTRPATDNFVIFIKGLVAFLRNESFRTKQTDHTIKMLPWQLTISIERLWFALSDLCFVSIVAARWGTPAFRKNEKTNKIKLKTKALA